MTGAFAIRLAAGLQSKPSFRDVSHSAIPAAGIQAGLGASLDSFCASGVPGLRVLVATALLLGMIPAMHAQDGWTFRPDLKRLNSSGMELPAGLQTVSSSDTIRVGVYMNVSTTDANPSTLGFESGGVPVSLAGSAGLSSTAIGLIEDSYTESSFTQNPSLLLQNSTFVIGAFSDVTDTYDIGFIDILGLTLPKGVRCDVPSGQNSCEIFLGTLLIALANLRDADFGTLTVSVGWNSDAIVDHNNDDGVKQSGNSVEYTVNPALPFLSSPTVNGSTLTLTASESLDSTTTPANDAFTVTVNGDDNAVTNVGISGTTVTLTLTDAVIQSDTVTVAYDAPATDFLTTGTEAVLSLTQADVTNNTLVSTDKTLSEISFDGSTVKGFDRTHAVRAYTTGVANSVSSAVLEATPNHAGAIVKVLRDGAVVHTADRGETAEYTVVMSSVGQPYWFQIQVEPEDPEASPETYDVIIGRQSTASGAWKVIDDLESGSLRDIDGLSGIWSDGTTTWVLDTDSLTVRAYEQDGTRDSTKDFSLDPDNDHPKGIWADDATIYVGQARTDTGLERNGLYAYRRSDRTRDSSKDLGVGDHATRPTLRDFWSDGETLWTASGIAAAL